MRTAPRNAPITLPLLVALAACAARRPARPSAAQRTGMTTAAPPSTPPALPSASPARPWTVRCVSSGSPLFVPRLAAPALELERVFPYDGPAGSLVARERGPLVELLWHPARGALGASQRLALDAPATPDPRWSLLSVTPLATLALRCDERAQTSPCTLYRLAPGGTAARVVRLAPGPVLVARHPNGSTLVASAPAPDGSRAAHALAPDGTLRSSRSLAGSAAPARTALAGLHFDPAATPSESGAFYVDSDALVVAASEAPERRVELSPAPLAACGPSARGVLVGALEGELELGAAGSRGLDARLSLGLDEDLAGAPRACVRALEARVEELLGEGWLAAGPSLAGTARTALGVTPVRCHVVQPTRARAAFTAPLAPVSAPTPALIEAP